MTDKKVAPELPVLDPVEEGIIVIEEVDEKKEEDKIEE